jgi:predicted MPP superfamily phosphohydrolase
MRITEYSIRCEKFDKRYVFALVSDLHGNDPTKTVEMLREIKPDYILAPGDIFEPLDSAENDKKNEAGFKLLRACAQIAPTFFSPGNHELGGLRSWSLKWKFGTSKEKEYSPENQRKISESGVVFLDDTFTVVDGIAFGGLASALIREDKAPVLEALDGFWNIDAPRVLLCHHPEYYEPYLKDKGVDLIVAGHAHGGQWRIFGRGVFAPGQGLFPKYTSGVHDNTLVISRGLKRGGKIPRIFNPPEIVKITVN